MLYKVAMETKCVFQIVANVRVNAGNVDLCIANTEIQDGQFISQVSGNNIDSSLSPYD